MKRTGVPEHYGLTMIIHLIHDAGEAVAHAPPSGGAFLEWTVEATGAGIVGLAAGAALYSIVGPVLAPIWQRLHS